MHSEMPKRCSCISNHDKDNYKWHVMITLHPSPLYTGSYSMNTGELLLWALKADPLYINFVHNSMCFICFYIMHEAACFPSGWLWEKTSTTLLWRLQGWYKSVQRTITQRWGGRQHLWWGLCTGVLYSLKLFPGEKKKLIVFTPCSHGGNIKFCPLIFCPVLMITWSLLYVP